METATVKTHGSIGQRAMLVKLSIRQWSAKVNDRKVSREVASQHGASEDAGVYSKALLAKDAIKAVTKAANKARTTHYELTLPWGDDGYRILSSLTYMKYSEAMRAAESEFWNAYTDLENNFPAYVEESRARLNGMFCASEFPTVERLKEYYEYTTAVRPMPEAADFRVSLGETEADAIRQRIEADIREQIGDAVHDAWTRLQTAVKHMAERLAAYDVSPEGKVTAPFRDSLVRNITDLLDLMPGFNLDNDPALDAFTDEIRSSLVVFEPEVLRDDAAIRHAVAQNAADIAAKMDAYI